MPQYAKFQLEGVGFGDVAVRVEVRALPGTDAKLIAAKLQSEKERIEQETHVLREQEERERREREERKEKTKEGSSGGTAVSGSADAAFVV